MKKINLRELYPDAYTTDFFVNVTEDVLETIRASERAEAAYERKMYRYKAQYSLDCENGIENTVLTKPQTPEMVLEEKQLQKQVYFRHSCTFCTPHFFYIFIKISLLESQHVEFSRTGFLSQGPPGQANGCTFYWK